MNLANTSTLFTLPEAGGPAIGFVILAVVGSLIAVLTTALMISTEDYPGHTRQANITAVTVIGAGGVLIVSGIIGACVIGDTNAGAREQAIITELDDHGITIDNRLAADLINAGHITVEHDKNLLEIDLLIADNTGTAGITINGEPV